MLNAIGVTGDEEQVYRLIVGTFDARPDQVAGRLGLSPGRVAAILGSLHAKGLVSRVAADEPRYAPSPPDVAFGPLLMRGQESLEWARSAVSQLVEEYRGGARRRDANQLVEVITGRAAIRQQLTTLQVGVRHEMRWFCRAGHIAMASGENSEEYEALARGVTYRVIYERAMLEEPGMIENVDTGIRAGEIARSATTLPIRMAIADDTIALCPLVQNLDGSGEPTAALVRESSLLAALIALFESYWERAWPLRAGEPEAAEAVPETDERHLLSLLVAGVTDKAIATRLGVSHRTVQRRIHDLMSQMNVQTRMQLGWEVSRLGWLDEPVPGPVGTGNR
ncbi:helix-turn-helix transcriptional regulator [Actinocrispum wychmicini]|uniref:Sugar-specific transcriptional regulator TrmB n=1 Tax=Actinocrispum wychmicini TaxID=1213861 RepID=A0A4R2IQC2_9PSEU|nr:LuxR family transcriptional regulator [Actinocrispum wychmicini]TCO47394.1 sugar-specific transcriptional regulator TrmB [Actinocrispum wychmicini]